MKVKIVKGGCSVNGKLVTRGHTAEVTDEYGNRLINLGAAVAVETAKAEKPIKKGKKQTVPVEEPVTENPETETPPDLNAEDPVV